MKQEKINTLVIYLTNIFPDILFTVTEHDGHPVDFSVWRDGDPLLDWDADGELVIYIQIDSHENDVERMTRQWCEAWLANYLLSFS